ncbi:MAG: hypothetical protein QGF07_03085, partial [Phycisphaerales bacterium]|nr:hypothetical protein [Phycisphaerales bacterium]
VVLAAVPVVAVWAHGRTNPMQYLHGSVWVAAIMACVTLAHVCRGQRVSIIAPIVLLTLTIPLLASAAFAYGDHAQLVRYFAQNTKEVLDMNGLLKDSTGAAVFEERLRSFGPMGWFTTPNVFSSVLISLGVVWSFIALALVRGKEKLYFWLSCFLATLCAVGAVSTFSKASVALLILSVFLTVILFYSKPENLMKKCGGWVAISIVLASVFVVFFRGCLTESAIGERSLLVRSQYFVGGLEIVGANSFIGVGPSQIQDAWLGVRPDNATEAINSTHNIVIDWLVSYGMLSICWITIIASLLWNAGQKMWICDRNNKRQVIYAGLGVAAIVLIVDAQIDLPMFDTGSTLFAFCLLGIAGVVKNDSLLPTAQADKYVSIIPLIAASVILYFGYAPLAHDEALQRNAATSLIANEPIEEVATVLADQSVTVQSKLIAAKLFMSAGNNRAATESLINCAPNSGVWVIRSKAAVTPEDAVFAAKKLVELDPNGLQSALLLADALWVNEERLEARLAYERVFELNGTYLVDPLRTLPSSRIELINNRLGKPQ